MTQKERLEKAIAYLKDTYPEFTNESISLGMRYKAPNYLSDVLSNGNEDVSPKFLERLQEYYGISREWVLVGKNKMIVGKPTPYEPPIQSPQLSIIKKTPAQGPEFTEILRMFNNLVEENKQLKDEINSLKSDKEDHASSIFGIQRFLLQLGAEVRQTDLKTQSVALGKLVGVGYRLGEDTYTFGSENEDKKRSRKKTEKAD